MANTSGVAWASALVDRDQRRFLENVPTNSGGGPPTNEPAVIMRQAKKPTSPQHFHAQNTVHFTFPLVIAEGIL
jgi:hypothetical protein